MRDTMFETCSKDEPILTYINYSILRDHKNCTNGNKIIRCVFQFERHHVRNQLNHHNLKARLKDRQHRSRGGSG